MIPTTVLCYYTTPTVNLPEVRLTPASLSLRSLSQKTSRLVDPASTQHMQNSIQDSATQYNHGDKIVQSTKQYILTCKSTYCHISWGILWPITGYYTKRMSDKWHKPHAGWICEKETRKLQLILLHFKKGMSLNSLIQFYLYSSLKTFTYAYTQTCIHTPKYNIYNKISF